MKFEETIGIKVKKSVDTQVRGTDKVIENPLLKFFRALLKKEEENGRKRFSRNASGR